MKLYHRTWSINADRILENAFDEERTDLIWFSNVILYGSEMKGSEGGGGDVVLMLDIEDELLQEFPPNSEQAVGNTPQRLVFRLPPRIANQCKIEIAKTDYDELSDQQLLDTIQRKMQGDIPTPIPGCKFGTMEALQEAYHFMKKYNRFRK